MKEQEPTILIVDDTPANLALLFDYLEQEHFTVLVAQSGVDALEQIPYFKPDLILLDVMMPGLDGFETCRLLKANPETCEIPVIFLTALTETVDKMRGFELGGVDYITKPIEEVEVLARVRTHLTIRDLHRRLGMQLESLEQQLRERNAQLASINQELSMLSGSYEAEMAQRRRHEQEKNNLLTIVTQQTEQWRTLTNWLIGSANAPNKNLLNALNEQVEQNLTLVAHSLDFVSRELAGESLKNKQILSHLSGALTMLQSTKSYLHELTCNMGHQSGQGKEALSILTSREQEVFQLLVDGKSPPEISRAILVSEGTVRSYRNRVMNKLDIYSVAGLVKFAIKHNLTELE